MKFDVQDMRCGGCANAITRAVTAIDATARLDFNVAAKIVKVDTSLPPEDVLKAIEAAGFHPTIAASGR